eukprot:Rhum_TRINITY_DN15145_c18_g1::Rhum_TRINITY_DN15145_c18_g1_i1::g.138834::m.138834
MEDGTALADVGVAHDVEDDDSALSLCARSRVCSDWLLPSDSSPGDAVVAAVVADGDVCGTAIGTVAVTGAAGTATAAGAGTAGALISTACLDSGTASASSTAAPQPPPTLAPQLLVSAAAAGCASERAPLVGGVNGLWQSTLPLVPSWSRGVEGALEEEESPRGAPPEGAMEPRASRLARSMLLRIVFISAGASCCIDDSAAKSESTSCRLAEYAAVLLLPCVASPLSSTGDEGAAGSAGGAGGASSLLLAVAAAAALPLLLPTANASGCCWCCCWKSMSPRSFSRSPRWSKVGELPAAPPALASAGKGGMAWSEILCGGAWCALVGFSSYRRNDGARERAREGADWMDLPSDDKRVCECVFCVWVRSRLMRNEVQIL